MSAENFRLRVLFHFADNTDNCFGFVWNLEDLSFAGCNIDFLVSRLTPSESRCRRRDFMKGRLRSHLLEPRYGKSLYALSIEGRCSFLSAAVTQSPDGYPAS